MKTNRTSFRTSKITGIITLFCLFLIEFVVNLMTDYFVSVSMIEWWRPVSGYGVIFWIVHVLVISYVFTQCYLKLETVKYLYLAMIIVAFLGMRLSYDFFMTQYMEDKLYEDFFRVARMCFFIELCTHIVLYMLFFLYAYHLGYRIQVNLGMIVRVVFFAIIILLCIDGAGNINEILEERDRWDTPDTISVWNVGLAFVYNMFYEYIIAFFLYFAMLGSLENRRKRSS